MAAPIFRARPGSCMHTTQVRGYNPMQLKYIAPPNHSRSSSQGAGLTELQGESSAGTAAKPLPCGKNRHCLV
jgi:hypothetical protein